MTDRVRNDAHVPRRLMQEAEAQADEARLAALLNPSVEVAKRQRGLMRLDEAERQSMAMSTFLTRVPDEFGKIPIETRVDDVEVTYAPHSLNQMTATGADLSGVVA